MIQIIDKAKEEFFQMINNFGSDPYHLLPHVPEVEKWAKYLLKKHPESDKEVVLLSVWLHDIGHYPIQNDIDHAITGEEKTRAFLEKSNYPKEKLSKVLHCVRSHRCKDVLPESIEAEIIACADSASHMTESLYFDMAKDDKERNQKFRVYDKMKRDFRDIGIFPEVQKDLKELLEGWEKLIRIYEKLDLK